MNLTLFVIPCKKDLGILGLQCCKNCHVLSDFSFKFPSSMTIFHNVNVRMQNIPKVDELKISWDDNICKLIQRKCHLKIDDGDIKCHDTKCNVP